MKTDPAGVEPTSSNMLGGGPRSSVGLHYFPVTFTRKPKITRPLHKEAF